MNEEILLIEDDVKLSRLIDGFLSQNHFQVTTAMNGLQGWELFQSGMFDAVVLDVQLPKMTGTEVLKKINTIYSYHPPILIITGHGDKSLAIEAIRYGAFDFLEKPFLPNTLKYALEKALVAKKEEIEKYRTMQTRVESGELTKRESEVAALASSGLTNEQIAEKIQVSSETVKSHLKNIFKKLAVENRASLSSRLKN